MVIIDLLEVRRLQADLERIRSRSIPFASRFALNKAAAIGRARYIENVKRDLIIRNKWTEKSIRFKTTRELRIASQKVSYGSLAKYMEFQEAGGVERKRGKEGVPIPTAFASGQPENTRPRTRPVRPSLRLSRVRINNRSRRVRNNQVIHAAAQSGNKNIFLYFGRTKGIFRVVGGKRNPRIKMLYDLTEQSVRTPRNPMLQPTIVPVLSEMPAIYARALQFQLDRIRTR